jgi:hypothetical protein
MHVRYRIYTESKDNIADLVSKFFDNFTLYHGTGYYKGISENSVTIEIILPLQDTENIDKLCNYIRIMNSQELVFCTVENVQIYSYKKYYGNFVDKSI